MFFSYLQCFERFLRWLVLRLEVLQLRQPDVDVGQRHERVVVRRDELRVVLLQIPQLGEEQRGELRQTRPPGQRLAHRGRDLAQVVERSSALHHHLGVLLLELLQGRVARGNLLQQLLDARHQRLHFILGRRRTLVLDGLEVVLLGAQPLLLVAAQPLELLQVLPHELDLAFALVGQVAYVGPALFERLHLQLKRVGVHQHFVRVAVHEEHLEQVQRRGQVAALLFNALLNLLQHKQ